MNMDSSAAGINLRMSGEIARVVIERPEKKNSFDEESIAALTGAFERISSLQGPARVVILSSLGETFSAGADLHWMRRMADFSFEENLQDARSLSGMFETVYRCPIPVIARVQGDAFGGGIGLAAAADCAIASSKARFSFSEVHLGLRPSTISLYCVPRLGIERSLDLFCTGRIFNADEAATWGLIAESVDVTQLDARVDALAASAMVCGKTSFRNQQVRTSREITESVTLPTALEGMVSLVRLYEGVSDVDEPSVREALREKLVTDIAKARCSSEAREKIATFLARNDLKRARTPE